MDNKKWDLPGSDRGRSYLKQLRVRGHLRTPQEGLQPGFTKPNPRKSRVNTGGSVSVCAGISGGKVVLWHYLPKRWSGEEAAKLFRGPVLRTLRRRRCRCFSPINFQTRAGAGATRGSTRSSTIMTPRAI